MDTDWILIKILKYDHGFRGILLKCILLLEIHTKIIKDDNFLISGLGFTISLLEEEGALNGVQ